MIRGSFKIFQISGIGIYVHWSFALLLILLLPITGSTGALEISVLWIVAIFASVLFHEFAHSLMARRLGLRIDGIVLLPIGGASLIQDIDRSNSTEFKTSVVGPLASFFLGALLLGIGYLTGSNIFPIEINPANLQGMQFSPFAVMLGWTNFALGIFNLIPAYPMDGGRIFKSGLSKIFSESTARRITTIFATVFAGLMVVYGIYYGDIFLSLIGIFIALTSNSQLRASGRVSSPAPTPITIAASSILIPDTRVLPAGITVGEVAPSIFAEGRSFPVFDGAQYLGMVGPNEIRLSSPGQRLYEVADKRVPLINLNTPVVLNGRLILDFKNFSEYPVVDHYGRLIGVISSKSLGFFNARNNFLQA